MTKSLKEQLVTVLTPVKSDTTKTSVELSSKDYEKLAKDHTGISEEDIQKLNTFNHHLINAGAEYLADEIEKSSKEGGELADITTIQYHNNHTTTTQTLYGRYPSGKVFNYGVEDLTVTRNDKSFSEKLSKRVQSLLEEESEVVEVDVKVTTAA